MSIAEDRAVPHPARSPSMPRRHAAPATADRDNRQMGPARRDHGPDDLPLGPGRARWNEIPHFILPGPDRVWDSLVNDWGILIDAAYLTGWITFLALASPWWAARGSRSCSTSRSCWRCRSTPTR
jgi:hypothetical protein